MKKVIFSAFILWMGMPTVVMAQISCKTKETCETFRKIALQNLKNQNTSEEIYQKVKVEIDQGVNHQIFILNLQTDVPWLEIDGGDGFKTELSSVLPGRYPNCISIKNKDGKPIDESGTPVQKGLVQCKKDSNRIYSVNDKLTVADSDAATACASVKGRLPTKAEFEKFRENESFLNLQTSEEDWFWVSSVFSLNTKFAFHIRGFDLDIGAYAFAGYDTGSSLIHRGNLDSVLCVRSVYM